jgi:hypothetical protein
MVNKLAVVLFTVAVFAMLALPVYASLMPMSWGFPTMVQNNSLTSFENQFALANDSEFSDISFPTTTSSVSGLSSFPTILQISNQSNLMSQFKFANQQQSMTFAYPWISVGFSPVPSMGFL